jgi:hypothetical protein
MTLLAMSGGDTALVILALFWGLLVIALCVVLLSTFNVLTSTKITIDTFREETVPRLQQVVGTVERTNRELDRIDGVLESAGVIVTRVEKLSGLVEQAASSPLVKIISMGAGLRKAASRMGQSQKRGGQKRGSQKRGSGNGPGGGDH